MKGMRWPLVWAVVFLAGCAGKPGLVDRGSYRVDVSRQAPSAFPRINTLVIHYTAGDFDSSLATLTGPDVSAHYLIPAQPPRVGGKPVIWQLVPEGQLAWHAGVSYWRGYTHLNSTSVGIELENSCWHPVAAGLGTGKRFAPFSAPQIAVLKTLAREIIARYHIPPQNVVAHADIAPQRKDDPGPLFPWQQLARQGIGAWPDPQRVQFYLQGRARNAAVDSQPLLALLARYGYQLAPGMTDAQQRRVITAFQMHFRPARYDGEADAETQAIAEALLEKYRQ
ncbi:N-acetylmuramoyl-L-alanine amidase [Shimwellia pseudoproteus]|uniref:N-acetylmuramoyl-L-alanine amidase n=1 Tax=Shimwellia pseudoproteus TaxID=570012 RepID=UPI0018EE1DC6|nr:N-acetylmuramoyl-L-alanine amidase [Shimwellia pseudoproteus]MBJ3816336.1 N-acetylmuramoyl-L-alanine amidase [Shimwellia pseudoproteus]